MGRFCSHVSTFLETRKQLYGIDIPGWLPSERRISILMNQSVSNAHRGLIVHVEAVGVLVEGICSLCEHSGSPTVLLGLQGSSTHPSCSMRATEILDGPQHSNLQWPVRCFPTAGSRPQPSRNNSRGASASTSSSSDGSFFTGGTGVHFLQQSRAALGHRHARASSVQSSVHDTVSPRLWRHRWRYMRSESVRVNLGLPKADWSRYHLQVNCLLIIL